MDLHEYIDALLYDQDSKFRQNAMADFGSSVFVTYSFASNGEFMDTSSATGYFEISETWKQNFRKALEIYEKYTGVKFVELSEEAKQAGTDLHALWGVGQLLWKRFRLSLIIEIKIHVTFLFLYPIIYHRDGSSSIYCFYPKHWIPLEISRLSTHY